MVHVGVGGRGVWPLEVMAGERFSPVALVDSSASAIDAARQKLSHTDIPAFDSLEQALKAVEADAVVICTPTRTHAAICRIAFANGKHVLVEKGMTMSFAEGRALVAEAQQAGVRFCVAQNYRYGAGERAIKQVLDDPSHPHHPGDVRIVDYIHHRYRPEPRTLDYPFAMVWDMGCHHVDSLNNWLGEPSRVTARSYSAPWSRYAHDANIAATIEYRSGAVCNYVLTHTATISDWRVILQGERGALRTYDVAGVSFYPRPAAFLGSSQPVACELPPSVRTEQAVAEDFHRYITEGIEPGISGRANLGTLAVCEMLVRSAHDGRTVLRSELD
jgi:predicted dehydrogenase